MGGTGFIPGATPLKAGFFGQPLLTLPSGLVIVPGVGVAARTDVTNKRLLLDASRGDGAECINHFTPGLLTVKTLATWKNDRNAVFPQQAAVGLIEANLGTPPGASVDGNNYLGLVLSAPGSNGIAGGSITLPLTAGHVVTDDITDAIIGRITSYPGGSSGNDDIGRGFAYPFTVSADTYITGIRIDVQGSTIMQGRVLRGQILDANRNSLAAQTILMPAATANFGTLPVFMFPEVVLLQQGQTYYSAISSDVPGDTTHLDVFTQSGFTPTYFGNLRQPGGGVYQMATNAPLGDWSNAQHIGFDGDGFERPGLYLMGSPVQVILTGATMTLALAVTGTPLAADLGDDLNVRVVLAAQ